MTARSTRPWAGAIAGGLENARISRSTVGSNLVLYSPRGKIHPFIGNQYVKVVQVGRVFRMIGYLGAGVGVAMDVVAVTRPTWDPNSISGAKFTSNAIFSAISLCVDQSG